MQLWKLPPPGGPTTPEEQGYHSRMNGWMEQFHPLSWDGDDYGVFIYQEPYSHSWKLSKLMEYANSKNGDYLTGIDGKMRRVPGDSVQVDGEFGIFTLDGTRYRVGLGK